ncbi:hypothetical protein AArcS_1544 [Natranaeroarchaeum sulfidigenes]|uniref:Uncharacterized protein n=1 Tax=Natranaeroarchaeum sulfidigenes TaxID=2784880 RepID=A0A897MX68_9EURY|nr:hypothetical protein AArcS_1544 [Natranaeroarchaeum sulfidigenes]
MGSDDELADCSPITADPVAHPVAGRRSHRHQPVARCSRSRRSESSEISFQVLHRNSILLVRDITDARLGDGESGSKTA